MSVVDPKGEEKYWDDGEPADFIKNPKAVDTGLEKFWVDGEPSDYLVPTGKKSRFLIIF